MRARGITPQGANAIADRRWVRIGRRFALQRLYLRYCFQQIPSTVGEECGAQVSDAEASGCD